MTTDYYTFWFKGVSDSGIKIKATGSVFAPAGTDLGAVFAEAKRAIKMQLPGVEPKDREVSVRKLKRKPR